MTVQSRFNDITLETNRLKRDNERLMKMYNNNIIDIKNLEIDYNELEKEYQISTSRLDFQKECECMDFDEYQYMYELRMAYNKEKTRFSEDK